jgi:hypothetical protein
MKPKPLTPGPGATDGPAPSSPVRSEPWIDATASERARRAAEARHKSGRRGLVDPATSDRDYSNDEVEFMQAMQEYKKRSGRMFPTWSEVLEVLVALGYRKAEGQPTESPPPPAPVDKPGDSRLS